MSQFNCQFWCKPHNKASVTCGDCGDFVFDNIAFLCKLCSERQHLKHQDHELVPLKEYIKMHKSLTKSTIEEKKLQESCKSILLVDDCETLCVKDVKALSESLHMTHDMPVNVLSIFGNTGDGKSHTLNHVFFAGQEVFATSSSQKPGTIGMWVAYDASSNTLVIDTEGLLGVSSNLNRRTRLLLKILALSDVALYRTRAERLHNDMFVFLKDASNVYCEHFSSELEGVLEKHSIDEPVSKLGPKVVVIHETQFTDTLDSSNEMVLTDDQKSLGSMSNSRPSLHRAEEEITSRFLALGEYPKAYSKIRYIGVKSGKQPTDFDMIREAVLEEVGSSSIRNSKSLAVIMETLQVLNSKFSNSISPRPLSTFSDQFFRCPTLCLTCGDQCKLSVSHDGKHSPSSTYCRYQHLHKNRVYICGKCYHNGDRSEVMSKSYEDSDSLWSGYAKMAWSGYVIECDKCGVIYRSRQYWYGNKPPELDSVRTEIVHVWPGEESRPDNTGRYILDQIYSVSETIGQYSAGPTQTVTDWINDQIAPPYWVPNHLITNCWTCKKDFIPLAQKHHCRACGNGFCSDCSCQSKPVPWRGWGYDAVRVCGKCFASTDEELTEEYLAADITAWKVSECIKTAASVVKSVVEVPASMVTDSVRPDYWVPDVDIIECYQCKSPITQDKHHCRGCGQGFCSDCTSSKRQVPDRGWTYPVRVCDTCSLTL